MCLSTGVIAEMYVFDDIYASIEVPEAYTVVITPNTIDGFENWFIEQGSDLETAIADFANRGVLLQAWDLENGRCFELRAVENEQSQMIFDINEQSESVRGSYRTGHYPHNYYTSEGYTFASASWNTTDQGRFLVMEYTKKENGLTSHKGYMRRTIRNGYEITLDMFAFDRTSASKDNTALNTVWNTFSFIEIQPLTPLADARINLESTPPLETNQQTITISGEAQEGVVFTTVLMGLTYSTPQVTEVTVGSSGTFSIPIEFPKEGVFLITMTAQHQGEDVMEYAFPITYQRTLLVINLDEPVPDVVYTDSLTISGIGEASASYQVYLNGDSYKSGKIAANGEFSIKIATESEAVYEILIVFSKKDLADRRLSYSVSREWTQEDMISNIKSQAIKPAYSTLVSKIEGYTGDIMGYSSYLLSATPNGSQWLLEMAMTKSGDNYKDYFYVISKEEPTASIGDQVMMYGTCIGMSENSADGESSSSITYPCFELLIFTSID